MARIPTTAPDLLTLLRSNNPTAPRLTWYGPDSERVELSGRVLENWVAKTANFLVDDLDAEPGSVVALDVPVHWRSLVWLLASWAVGATVHTGTIQTGTSGNDAADIVATTDPAAASASFPAGGRSPLIVAVALPALAMRWTAELPADAIDYSGEVRAHSDVYFPDNAPDGESIAWESPAGAVSFADLFAAGSAGVASGGPERVLLQARDGWAGVVSGALAAWAGGGSVVLLDPSVADSEHLRGVENVTR
ncbi:TIGR03089 family protein [Specibacter sp. RAF43]|uniref:TIGR03089 family protein n=1 Tax=Specibacter sp. RAF43 TaxID=3233057 RepID=UPI003F9A19B1